MAEHDDNFQNDDVKEESKKQDFEDLDIKTPMWFYEDSTKNRQGPFSFKEMFLWYRAGYFPATLRVRNVWEDEFRELGSISQYKDASQKLIDRVEKEQQGSTYLEVPTAMASYNTYTPNPTYQEYSVAGGFNPQTGKFQTKTYFESKGIANDRDVRMMSNFLDPSQLQGGKDKKKGYIGTKKFWKDRKEKKRKAKMVADYLAD